MKEQDPVPVMQPIYVYGNSPSKDVSNPRNGEKIPTNRIHLLILDS